MYLTIKWQDCIIHYFVANVNSRSLYAIARPSVVCNVRAP